MSITQSHKRILSETDVNSIDLDDELIIKIERHGRAGSLAYIRNDPRTESGGFAEGRRTDRQTDRQTGETRTKEKERARACYMCMCVTVAGLIYYR